MLEEKFVQVFAAAAVGTRRSATFSEVFLYDEFYYVGKSSKNQSEILIQLRQGSQWQWHNQISSIICLEFLYFLHDWHADTGQLSLISSSHAALSTLSMPTKARHQPRAKKHRVIVFHRLGIHDDEFPSSFNHFSSLNQEQISISLLSPALSRISSSSSNLSTFH